MSVKFTLRKRSAEDNFVIMKSLHAKSFSYTNRLFPLIRHIISLYIFF